MVDNKSFIKSVSYFASLYLLFIIEFNKVILLIAVWSKDVTKKNYIIFSTFHKLL